MAARHIVFRGRVQGVGFRYTAHRIAMQYGLTGWVRNVCDGTVEMVLQGSQQQIHNCLKDIQESFQGYINNITVDDIEHDSQFEDFKITF